MERQGKGKAKFRKGDKKRPVRGQLAKTMGEKGVKVKVEKEKKVSVFEKSRTRAKEAGTKLREKEQLGLMGGEEV